jgi:hypothetical protein
MVVLSRQMGGSSRTRTVLQPGWWRLVTMSQFEDRHQYLYARRLSAPTNGRIPPADRRPTEYSDRRVVPCIAQRCGIL